MQIVNCRLKDLKVDQNYLKYSRQEKKKKTQKDANVNHNDENFMNLAIKIRTIVERV